MSQESQSSQQVRSMALRVLDRASDQERSALVKWAEAMLQIRMSDLSTFEKAKRSIQVTADARIIVPMLRQLTDDLKRIGWTERSVPARFALGGVIAALTLSGSGAGVAALGGAIGLPLWVVLGAGGAFAGVIIDEATRSRSQRKPRSD